MKTEAYANYSRLRDPLVIPYKGGGNTMFYLTRIAGAIIVREDGRMVHDYYVFRVKKPSESKSPWDLYALEATLPGDQAFPRDKCEALPQAW